MTHTTTTTIAEEGAISFSLRNNVLTKEFVKGALNKVYDGDITFDTFIDMLNDKINRFTNSTTTTHGKAQD